MDKLKFRRSGIQARVLALTMFFTLGASLVIAASNMHQMTAEWERTTILNAEYALQTAASAIRRDMWMRSTTWPAGAPTTPACAPTC